MLKSHGISDIESRIRVSNRCHICFPMLGQIDRMEETWRGTNAIGTTLRGMGPTHAVKVSRHGIRMCDLVGCWNKFEEKFINLVKYLRKQYNDMHVNIDECLMKLLNQRKRISGMVVDTVVLINTLAKKKDSRIIIEGAQCSLLDIDVGTYPFVTSSSCTVGAICSGLGLAPSKINDVYGVIKAYTIRIGAGPFPTELFDEVGDRIQQVGKEWGATTGRKRRVGWLDTVLVRYSHLINNFSALALTKIDVLDGLKEVKIGKAYLDRDTGKELTEFPADCHILDGVSVAYKILPGWQESTKECRHFSDLPVAAQQFVFTVEDLCRVPIRWVGTGPSLDAIIDRFV